MKPRSSTRLATAMCAAAITILQALPSEAGLLVNFPFDEGTGRTATDTVGGAVGWFGYQNPATDQVTLMNDSPSGLAGDRCITNTGRAFLLVDDSVNPVLAITNGPITIETWVHINIDTPAKTAEGLVGYGQTYKLGMRGGWQVFTLFGLKDITNSSAPVPAGKWTHLAAAWEPGVGVHFYIDGNHTMVADTNLVARPPVHNLLAIGSDSPTNGYNPICAMDRVRVHNALLDGTQIDSDPANVKPLLASTVVGYDFNEASFPCQNGKAPARPTMLSTEFYANTALPVWTNDTPTGLPSDRALSFNMGTGTSVEKERINIDSPTLNLRGTDDMTNYTVEAWVKLPTTLINDREVLFRTYGPAPRISVSIDAKRNLHTTMFGSADYASSVIIPNDNRWHHIAISMVARANVQFFLDGVLRQTMAANTKAATGDTSTGFLIGQENNARYLRGLMDRVRVWDSALTAAELDFPAIPGLALITTQPTNTVGDVGGTAQFVAGFSSASSATSQWFYKTTPAGASVPVPNATGTTLTLTSLTPEKQGFYLLRITNSVGVTETYAAQLAVRSGAQFDTQGFESPKYFAGAFEDQDLWTVDQNAGTYLISTASEIEQVLTSVGITPGQTVHGGSQALLIAGPSVASVGIRPVLGFETQSNLTFEFCARPLTAGNTTLVTNNVFLTLENSAGTRAAAIRFGPSRSIDYNVNNAWVPTGRTWDNQTWHRFTLQLDYTARKYDVFIDGTKLNASPLAFYASTSDKFQQIRIYRGANQAGVIIDDMFASVPLKISTIAVANGTVTINWLGGVAPYQIQRRASLTTGQWDNVGTTTTSTQGTDTAGAGPMFYRVVGQ